MTTEQLYSIVKLRTDVFFVEQRIDEEELDNRDQEPTTEHYWIADDTGVLAYLRFLVDDKPSVRDAQRLFGRVVVRADHRGRGLAQKLIAEVLVRHGHEPMLLHSQQYIVPLYQRFGFEAIGDSYIEAGIPHQLMYRAGFAG